MMGKLLVKHRLLELKMEEKSDLQDHFIKFETIISELRESGERLNNTEEVRVPNELLRLIIQLGYTANIV